jgi:hypothetical protein
MDRWLPIGRGETRCVDALIRLVRMLPIEERDIAGDAERPLCGLPADPDVDPDRRCPGESREPLHLDVVE